MLGQSVRLQPVPIQSLSELERARLQEVALYHLDERDLDFKISIPRGTESSLIERLTLAEQSCFFSELQYYSICSLLYNSAQQKNDVNAGS